MNKLHEDMDLFTPEISIGCIRKDSIFALAANNNGVYEINMFTGKTRVIGALADEKYSAKYSSSSFIEIENKVIFAPDFAKNIYELDIMKKSIEKVDVDKKVTGISQMIKWNDKIIMIPATGKDIVFFDYKNKKIITSIDIYSFIQNKFNKKCSVFTNTGVYEYKDVLYCALWEFPYIVKIELNSKEISLTNIGDICNGIVQMIGIENKLIIIGNNNKIIFIHLDDMQINVIDLSDEKESKTFRSHYFLNKSTVILWSNTLNQSIKLNIFQEKVESDSEPLEIKPSENEHFYFFTHNKEKVVFISDKKRLFVKNILNNTCSIISLEFDIDKDFLKHILNEPVYLCEKKNDLNKYIKFLV